jgi:hypothetical protein
MAMRHVGIPRMVSSSSIRRAVMMAAFVALCHVSGDGNRFVPYTFTRSFPVACSPSSSMVFELHAAVSPLPGVD